MIPVLMITHLLFPNFIPQILSPVIDFSIVVFPITLFGAFLSGILDGLTRFKTLDTPLLKSKIYYGAAILILSIAMLLSFIFMPVKYTYIDLVLSLIALFCAVKLGMMGKELLNVILPGTYQKRKKKVVAKKTAAAN